MVSSVTTREPEFTSRDLDLLLALQRIEADVDPVSGLAMSVVTDPKNQFKFVTRQPTMNWAAKTLEADQKSYYDALDTDKVKASRAGHLWSVYLPEPVEPESE